MAKRGPGTARSQLYQCIICLHVIRNVTATAEGSQWAHIQ